ncbi:hypothetical protein [Izhakiella australiensis]|nr:hypothetical protein [Izhakiella australiensis]
MRQLVPTLKDATQVVKSSVMVDVACPVMMLPVAACPPPPLMLTRVV